MAKDQSSKTILIIIAIILGVLLIGGLLVGFSCYYLYKIGSQAEKTSTSTSTTNWQTYGNTRYGFSIKYPATFQTGESINGDGVVLTSSSPGITINASASLNSQNQTLDEYLNMVRADLFKGAENAEETFAGDTMLSGSPAQERKWQYTNTVDPTQTVVVDQITSLKGNNFYTVRLIINNSDYSEYAPMFDQVLQNFKIQ